MAELAFCYWFEFPLCIALPVILGNSGNYEKGVDNEVWHALMSCYNVYFDVSPQYHH